MLLSGVFLLTFSNITVKVIGMLFKVPISYILTDEGMGYFNVAYTIYIWLYMLSTAGVPVGVSILVSKARAQGREGYIRQVGKASLCFFGMLGLLGTAALICFADTFATAVGTQNASFAVMAIAPTLFFVCIGSVLRGYYQGHALMQPTAVSQLLEALGKLLPGILLAHYAAKKGFGLPLIAAYAIFGVTIGAFLSMVYLVLANQIHRRKLSRKVATVSSRERVFGPLLAIVLPVTLSSCVMSVTSLIDLSMIMRRLQSIGYSQAQSAALYGNYTTLAVPVFNLPSVLIYPIAYAIVPILSNALVQKKEEEVRQVEAFALKLTALLAFPCALGIGAFAYPILSAIFEQGSASLAAPYLTVLSPGIVFMCLLATTNAILQARGKQNKPILSMVVAAAVKLIADFFLIGQKEVGMFGAAVGTVLFYFVAVALNFCFLMRKSTSSVKMREVFFKPLFISLCAVLPALALYKAALSFLSSAVALLICIAAAALIFLFLILIFGSITENELSYLPLKAKHINGLQAFLGRKHVKIRKKSTNINQKYL